MSLRKISQADSFSPVNAPEPGPGKASGPADGPGPMRFAGLGIQLAVSLVVFVLIGRWADRKLGTGGVVTIAAAFLGFGGTMYSLIRALNKKDGADE